jgi:hypothetical protein
MIGSGLIGLGFRFGLSCRCRFWFRLRISCFASFALLLFLILLLGVLFARLGGWGCGFLYRVFGRRARLGKKLFVSFRLGFWGFGWSRLLSFRGWGSFCCSWLLSLGSTIS